MAGKKGYVLSKTMMFLILTFVLLGALAPAMLGAADEAVRRSMFLQADQIAGIINVLQSAPAGTFHKFSLPAGGCEMKINSLSVSMINGKLAMTKEVVSSIQVAAKSVNCETAAKKEIYFMRCGNLIKSEERAGCA